MALLKPRLIEDQLGCGCSRAANFSPDPMSPTASTVFAATLALSATAAVGRRGVSKYRRVLRGRETRRLIEVAQRESARRQRPISDLFRELSPVGSPDVNARRYSSMRGLLKAQELIVAPVTGESCTIFCSAVLQKCPGNTFRTVASLMRTSPSVLRLAEQGEAWELVLRGQAIEHGEAVLRGFDQGLVTIVPPFHRQLSGPQFDPPLSFVSEPGEDLSQIRPLDETSGFHLSDEQVSFRREVDAQDDDDVLESLLGVGHPFLANRYPHYYTNGNHGGYLIIEAVVPAGQLVSVCGYATTPDKTMTILPTVVVEAEGMLLWCGGQGEAPRLD